jgi:hypothetical protein
MLVCCYALRSSILEIHLLGEVPGGVLVVCCGIFGISLLYATRLGTAELGGYRLCGVLRGH